MTKKEFIEMTGEDPVDVLGQDWKNEIEDLSDGSERLGMLKGIPPDNTLKRLKK